MLNSFNIALSGLRANASAIDTTGDNLANLNTIGFKANSADFLNMVSSSMGEAQGPGNGIGVSEPLDFRQFTQGTLQNTGAPLSAAIQGDGFFVVSNAGQTEYTRAGNFTLDKNGALVTASGEKVQGWMAAADGSVSPSSSLGNIAISPNQVLAPAATTLMSADINLDASAVGGKPSGTYATPIQVVDSLGVTHTLTLTFTKPSGAAAAAGSWDYAVTVPPSDLTGTTSAPLAKGTLTFDTNGNLKTPAPATAATGEIEVDVAGLKSGAADMKVMWSLYKPDGTARVTQFASPSSVAASSQDGNTAAQLTGIAIGDGGQLMATYSNGTRRPAAQLAMAAISNPQSLESVGNNNFVTTSNTATPAIGMPQTGGRGQIVGQSVEASNVDLATEFTNLITYQRAYQADSKVITTTDDLTQTTVNLIRQ